MRRLKIIFSIFFIIVLILSCISIVNASDVSQTNRHIAMIYDDSTSMYVSDTTNKPVLNWAYANYMTQAFCALLNKDDSLYITYMSDYKNESANLLDGDINQAVQAIREQNNYIDETPFKAVETAYEKLFALDESLQDEYWLVILTDGAFTDFNGDITKILNGYIDEMAKNSKTLKVVFFAIGKATNKPESDDGKGLFVYQTGTDEIVSTMAILADNISGRHNVAADKMNALSNNTLSIDMVLPIRSLIVFGQLDENILESISNNKNEDMEIISSYKISAPDEFKYSSKIKAITDTSAIGNIMRIEPSEKNTILSDGRYILNFSKEVNIENIRVMYEPAIDIKIQYKKDNKIIIAPADGEVVDIEVILVNAQTGKPFNQSLLPAKIYCNIQVLSDGDMKKTSDEFIIKDIILQSENLSVITEINMPSYFTLRNKIDYIEKFINIETPASTAKPAEYDESAGPWPPEVKLLIKTPYAQNIKLNTLESAEPYVFMPLFNDKKGSLRDLQSGQFEVICTRDITFEVEINTEDMGYDISLKYSGNMYSTSTGLIQVKVIFKSEYDKIADTSFSFTIEELSWLKRNFRIFVVPFISSLFVIAILGILVLRRKFAKQSWLEYSQQKKDKDGNWTASVAPARASLANANGGWRFIPFFPEQVKISGITFKASINDQLIKIPRKFLKSTMGTSHGPLSKRHLKNDFMLHSGNRFYVEQNNTRIVFVYHGPKSTLLTAKKGKKKK